MPRMPEHLNITTDHNHEDTRDFREVVKKGDRVNVTNGTARYRTVTYVVASVYKNSVDLARETGSCPDCKHPMKDHHAEGCDACTEDDNYWSCEKKEKMTEKDNNDHVRVVKTGGG